MGRHDSPCWGFSWPVARDICNNRMIDEVLPCDWNKLPASLGSAPQQHHDCENNTQRKQSIPCRVSCPRPAALHIGGHPVAHGRRANQVPQSAHASRCGHAGGDAQLAASLGMSSPAGYFIRTPRCRILLGAGPAACVLAAPAAASPFWNPVAAASGGSALRLRCSAEPTLRPLAGVLPRQGAICKLVLLGKLSPQHIRKRWYVAPQQSSRSRREARQRSLIRPRE